MASDVKRLPQHALPKGLVGRFNYVLMPIMHKEIYANVARVADLRPEDGKDHSKYVQKYGYRVWSESEIRTLVEQAGFSGVEVQYAEADGMPKMMLVEATKAA